MGNASNLKQTEQEARAAKEKRERAERLRRTMVLAGEISKLEDEKRNIEEQLEKKKAELLGYIK